MTIKEIAHLAGVSTSTVSKIVNGKDENINAVTRERVLQLVKEYNYSPYSMVKNVNTSKTFLLGVLLRDKSRAYAVLQGILECAQERGYRIVVCESAGDLDLELKNVLQLCKYKVDGVLWEMVSEDSEGYRKYFQDIEAPVCEIALEGQTPVSADGCGMNFEQIGYCGASELIGMKHTAVACVVNKDAAYAGAFLEGYKQALFDGGIGFSEQLYFEQPVDMDRILYQCGASGIVCSDQASAMEIYAYAKSRKVSIPEDFSVVTVSDGLDSPDMDRILSRVRVPYGEFGRYVCGRVIDMAEKREVCEDGFQPDIGLISPVSIDMPRILKDNRILVVGNVNMDIIVNVEELPLLGKTVKAKKCTSLPGGKGANQAVGVARLGSDVSLIGKVGRDYEGSAILNNLSVNQVDISSVILENHCETGKAYIHVRPDGESSIAIYPGANDQLGPADIDRSRHYFENTKFCLVQTELPLPTVYRALETARKYGAKVILKPSAMETVEDRLLAQIDYFIPNRKECNILCPDRSDLEEQAEYFLEKGVGNVIVTLGQKGCYLKNREISRYFAAEEVIAVDTTGAADAFISALAVFLARKHGLEEAVQYANCAASLSVTREGVIPSLVDMATLDMHMRNRHGDGPDTERG